MALTPMMQQYLSIKDEYKDTLLFFRLGDFYEMFFEDAITASRELEITLTGRDAGIEERVPMCGVPYHAAEGYMKRLIERGFKVAICEQVEDPAQAKGIVRREVVRVYTPGTYLDDGTQESIYIATLIQQTFMDESIAYSICLACMMTGDVYVQQKFDIEALLDFFKTYKPAEIIAPTHIVQVLEQRIGQQLDFPITFTCCEDFKRNDSQDYRMLLQQQFSVNPAEDPLFQSNPGFIDTCGILLEYLQKTQKKVLQHLKYPVIMTQSDTLILDNFSRRNLELTETLRDRKKQGSLYGVLDQTVTAMGSRLLKQWLLAPLQNKDHILKRQDAVEELAQQYIARQDLKQVLRNVYDLERLIAKLSYGTANAKDLVALAQTLQQVPPIKALLENFHSLEFLGIQEDLDGFAELEDRITQAIIQDPPTSVKDGGLISDGYDSELDRIRFVARSGKTWIAELEQKERERTGIKSLKIGFNKVFGYYIEVTKTNIQLVPSDYERKQTLANAERYVTSELKQREAEILHAEEQLFELEYALFVQIRDYVVEHVATLQRIAASLAKLDVYFALATVASEYGYVRPVIDTNDQISIQDGRHPVVERMLQGKQFVANDTQLDCNEQQIMLITGPNMAGKSTYMRQVALIVILAHIGSFVPAKSACIGLVDRVFTRIGAADDLAGGQSTFMVEMVELANILQHATARSLVILDEIGRGTSTYDGISIARAVIEYLHGPTQVGAKTLFATHYHELTILGNSLKGVQNFSTQVEDIGNSIVFLRKVIPQPADRSYGIHVAKLAGLPETVLERADEILAILENGTLREMSGNSETASTAEIPIISSEAIGGIKGVQSIPISRETADLLPEDEALQLAQLSLFTEEVQGNQQVADQVSSHKAKNKHANFEAEILNQIKNLDLIRMTPFDAMNQLFTLQEALKSKNQRR